MTDTKTIEYLNGKGAEKIYKIYGHPLNETHDYTTTYFFTTAGGVIGAYNIEIGLIFPHTRIKTADDLKKWFFELISEGHTIKAIK